jgi:HEAT repeat protein
MNRIYYLIIITFIFSLNTSIFAGELPEPDHIVHDTAILSLLTGLESDNLGLKTSCAYLLGELEVSEAVIPLMKILKGDMNEQARISAALALYKIGTPLSIYAVKQAIKFDESERVSKLAKYFYRNYLLLELAKDDNIRDNTYATKK